MFTYIHYLVHPKMFTYIHLSCASWSYFVFICFLINISLCEGGREKMRVGGRERQGEKKYFMF